MRAVTLVVCAVLALQAAASNDGAELRAKAWLASHKAGQPDMGDLNDFAKSDPNGFALVKALMLKRSLGLLDPRKPTASFAAPAPHESNDDEPVGAAAFEKFAAPGEVKKHAAMVAEVTTKAGYSSQDVSAVVDSYVAAAPVTHVSTHSFDFKATDDDDMVASVLGQATELTGGRAQGSLLSQSRDMGVSHLTTDEMALGTAASEASGIKTFVAPSSAAEALDTLKPAALNVPKYSEAPVDAAPALVTPFEAPKLHLVPVDGVPEVKAPVTQPKVEIKAQVVPTTTSTTQAPATANNPYLQGIDLSIKKPAQEKASAPMDTTPLDFNKEIAKMSATPAKHRVSLSAQSQKVGGRTNKFMDDIGFTNMLDGQAGQDNFKFHWATDGRAVLEESSSPAAAVRPIFRKSASMIKEFARSVSDFHPVSSEGAELGKFLGHDETDELEDTWKSPMAAPVQNEQVQSEQASNPYMTDLS